MWAYLPDTEAWKDNKKNQAYQEQYLQEKLEREKREQEQKRQKIRNSLSLEQRDKEIRKLISQLKLDESHRKQLLQRGLTAAQIEKNGYRSVNQWHKFSIPVDSRLAGVSINGNKLNNPDSGILCPVINADGLFVGLRINNENWQAKELGKYTWLSSSGRGIDNKIPVSDIDEEFPSAIHYPEQWTDFTRIGICEGLEYKSAIAANRLGYPVIGFSGNDFTSSPNLFKKELEKIQEQILCHTQSHAKKVSPTYQSKDSSKQLSNTNLSTASTRNLSLFLKTAERSKSLMISPHLTNSTMKSGEILKNQKPTSGPNGFKINQGQKINTLESISPIKITLIPDSGINDSVSRSYLKAIEHYKDYDLEIAYWGHFYEKGNDIDEIAPDTTIYYLKPQEAQELLTPLTNPEFLTWYNNRKFTSDILINQQWLSEGITEIPQEETITFIKSGLGTGKTTLLKKWLSESWSKIGAFSLGYRNTLLRHFCEATGFYHIHEDNFQDMRFDPNGQFALCVDSLLKFKPEDFDDKIIILDEVKSIIPHLLTSSTIPKKSRNQIINLFKEAIRRASRVIALDGNLNDWVVEFLRESAPDKEIVRIENAYRKARQLYNYTGSVTCHGKINNRDRTGIIAKMLNSPRPAIVADSQKHCEELDELLTKFGYSTLRIDSLTSGNKDQQLFLANPDAYLTANEIDALILSPSAESGIDISIKGYFTDLFILAFGTLGVDSIRQISQRIRDDIPTHLWVNQSPKVAKQISRGYQEIINEITEYSQDRIFALEEKEEFLQRISESFDRNLQRIETKTAQTVQDIEAFEKSNYQQTILFAFEQDGYTINQAQVGSSAGIKRELKEIREGIQRDHSQQIFLAEPSKIEDEEQTIPKSELEKYAQIKAGILRQLPGIEETEIWDEEFIYQTVFKHPNYLKRIDNLFLFNNPVIADALRDKQLRYITTNLLRNHDISLWEFSRRYELTQGLREVGLDRILNAEEGTKFTYQNEIIKDIYNKLRRSPRLRQKLGIDRVSKYSIREINRLLKMIGMKFRSEWVPAQDGNRSYRVYILCQENTNLPYRPICLELTANKWTKWVENEILNLSESVNNNPQNLSREKIAKLFSLHSLKLVTHSLNKLHNNQALSVINQVNEPRLIGALREVQQKIAQSGVSAREGDSKFRAYITENALEVAQDLADFIQVEWQIFKDFLDSVGDSVKYQLFGLLQGLVTG